MASETVRYLSKQRLAYYRLRADADFWDAHWQEVFSQGVLNQAAAGDLGMFKMPFEKYLPKSGRILEAGCGLGQYVLALRARGYQAEGIEWGPRTVQYVKSIYPHLPLRVADVTRLDVPNGCYKGYISLGVVEHRQAGPEPFLIEAYRVLAPQGVALISVPYFNRLRRLKAAAGFFRQQRVSADFYQYAFSQPEFTAIVQQVGFDIIDTIFYDGYKGLKDEIVGCGFLLRHLFKVRGVGWRLQHWLRYSSLGHMMLLVCVKR